MRRGRSDSRFFDGNGDGAGVRTFQDRRLVHAARVAENRRVHDIAGIVKERQTESHRLTLPYLRQGLREQPIVDSGKRNREGLRVELPILRDHRDLAKGAEAHPVKSVRGQRAVAAPHALDGAEEVQLGKERTADLARGSLHRRCIGHIAHESLDLGGRDCAQMARMGQVINSAKLRFIEELCGARASEIPSTPEQFCELGANECPAQALQP